LFGGVIVGAWVLRLRHSPVGARPQGRVRDPPHERWLVEGTVLLPVTIRTSTDEYVAFLYRGFTAYLEEERQRVPVLGMADDFAETYIPRLVAKVRDREGEFLVAEQNGERCGYIVAVPKPPDPWDQTRSPTAMVMELYFVPAHRRGGVGRMLFGEIERRFAARGFDWVTFGVMATNANARGSTLRSVTGRRTCSWASP
jgi:GNAT superfamily N-acetyltransferase